MDKRIVTVFGSGDISKDSGAWQEAYQLGGLIAKAGMQLCNGGYGGIMEAAAKGVKENGGHTIGVTVALFRHAAVNQFIDEEIREPSWQTRLSVLIEKGDGFIVLDGAVGTLTEMMTVWEMLNKGLISKPMALLGKEIRSVYRLLCRVPGVSPHENIIEAGDPVSAIDGIKKKPART